MDKILTKLAEPLPTTCIFCAVICGGIGAMMSRLALVIIGNAIALIAILTAYLLARKDDDRTPF